MLITNLIKYCRLWEKIEYFLMVDMKIILIFDLMIDIIYLFFISIQYFRM